jgi:acetyl esterase/lipase
LKQWRDEGEAYDRKLIQAGVEVVTTTIHDFVMLNALAEAPPTRAASRTRCRFSQERACSEALNREVQPASVRGQVDGLSKEGAWITS